MRKPVFSVVSVAVEDLKDSPPHTQTHTHSMWTSTVIGGARSSAASRASADSALLHFHLSVPYIYAWNVKTMTQDFQVLLETTLRSYIWIFAVWLLSLSTVAPNQNKERWRLRSPAVIGWERPNLGYKYPVPSLYLVWVPLWREAQFSQ